MLLSIRLLVAAGLLASAAAVAAQTVPDGEPRIVKFTAVVRPAGEGRFELQTVQELAVDSDAAVRRAGQMVMGYNGALEQLDVIGAYTQKPDGTQVVVPTEAIMRRDASALGNTPSLSDVKALVVVFPELAVGDRVHLELRKRSTVFPGQLAALYFLGTHARTDLLTVEIHLPRSTPLYVDNLGFEASTTDETDGRVYRFRASNPIAELREEGALSSMDYARRLAVSTFASHAELARAYADGADDKAAPTDEVRKLAASVAGTERDPRRVAERLYAWVGKNVRYLAVMLGAGMIVPHPAGEVLGNRYGDCKDQTTLLQALLAARGIESTTALLNAQPSFWVSRVPVLENFNHAVVYVPSLDLFLDPTAAGRVPFGKLPFEDQGKAALLIRTGEFRTTPVESPGDNTTTRRTRYDVKEDGSIAAQVEIEATGRMADAWRGGRLATEDQRKAAVRKLTAIGRYVGDGTMEVVATDDPGTGAQVRARFVLSGALEWPGAGAMEIPEGLTGPDSLQPQVIRGAAAWKRPHLAAAGSVRHEYEIVFPARMKILAVPRDVRFENDVAAYSASYQLEGRTLRVVRQLSDRFSPPLLRPDQAKLIEEFSATLARDLRAQVVYAEEGP